MSTQNNDNQPSRALIPAPQRAIEPKRWLPSPATQKLALGVTVSAVGSLLLKRLVELAAEDLYRIGRSTIERSIARWQVSEPPEEQSDFEVQQHVPFDPPADLPPGRYRIRACFTRVGYFRALQSHTDGCQADND